MKRGHFREFSAAEREQAEKWAKPYHAKPLRYYISSKYLGGRVYVWPVDEFIGRHPEIDEATANRLRELNPDGVIEGEFPIGWKGKVIQ